jgi:hypothetical protein
MAVYASFGYTHSVVGREAGRPRRTPRALKIAAVGFLLVAVGLFTIPHQANVIELVQKAASAGAEQHDRSLAGMGLIAVGLALGVGGWTRVPREPS